MNKLPQISINLNKKKEAYLFLKFLNHTDFPQHRKLILQAFPDLKKELIENSKNERKIIVNFIKKFYKLNKDTIDLAVCDCKKEMGSNTKAIKALGKSMDYCWENNINYVAAPTILPFSPFGENIFYFSILDRIKKTCKRNILNTAIHEISHFIFFDQLRGIEKRGKFPLSLNAKYYIKETITTAIFNEEPLKSALGINDYLGNPDIRDIYIMDKNKKIKTFINYTRHQYIKNRNNGNDFKVFLNELIININKVSEEFSKKRYIWNKFGKELFKNKKAFKEYKQPIKLK